MKSDSAQTDAPEAGKKSSSSLLWLMVWLYVIAAVFFIAVKWALLPNLDRFGGLIQTELSRLVGKQIRFDSLKGQIDGLTPSFELHNLQITNQQGDSVLSIENAQVELSWFSVLTLEPRVVELQVSKPYLRIDQIGADWLVAGYPLASENDPQAKSPVLELLFKQGRLQFQDGRIGIFKDGVPQGEFTDVRFDLMNTLGRHQFSAQANQVAWLNRPLTLEAEFSSPVWGLDLADWTSWTGRLHAVADLARLPESLIPMPPGILTSWPATSSVEFWAKMDKGKVPEATALVSTTQLNLKKVGDSDLPVAIPEAQGWLILTDLDPRRQTGHLQLRNLTASLKPEGIEEIRLGPLNANGSRMLNNEQVDWQFGFEGLAASRALAFAQQLAPVFMGANWDDLKQYKAEGQISAMSLQWSSQQDQFVDLVGSPIRGALSFRNLSVLHTSPDSGQQAGFENLSGDFSGNKESGSWSVQGKQSKLILQELFDKKSLDLDVISGQGSWSNLFSQDQAVKLGVESLELENADLAGHFSGEYLFVENQSDVIDLKGKLDRAKVGAAPAYLPKVIGKQVRTWLANNLRQGDVNQGEFVARGKVEDFPFYVPGTDGQFLIRLPVKNAGLTFAPEWPAISAIDGVVTIEGKSLTVTADSALTDKVILRKVNASIPNMDAWEPILRLSGEGEGKLEDLVRYANQSPIAYFIDNALAESQVKGQSGLKLDLTVPIAKPAQTQVNGALALDGNSIRLVQGMPWVHRLKGDVEFSNKGLNISGLNGEALGNPVSIVGGNQLDGRLVITAKGSASAEGLAGFLNPLIAPYLKGSTPFDVVVSNGRGGGLEIDVRSQLEGMEVRLPEPFPKPADQSMSFRLTRKTMAEGQRWEAQLGPLDKPLGYVLAGVKMGDEAGLEFLNASFGRPHPVERRGIQIRLGTDSLDVDAWRIAIENLFGQNEQTRTLATGLIQDLMGEADQSSRLPIRVELIAKRLKAASKEFEGVRLVARSIEDRWQFDMTAQGIDGYFSWVKDDQRPNGAVLGRFAELTIPESLDSETRSMMDDPVSSIPALDIEANQFTLGELNLGSLKLLAVNQTNDERAQAAKSNAPQEWRLQEMRIVNPESVTTANGIWRYGENLTNQSTDIQIKQTVTDGGGLLDRLGKKGVFKGGQGSLEGRLVWNDAPTNIDYASLNGNFKLISKKGQFLKADPGVAKLLGVLSLQGITRRLSLDFNDLFAQGFAYDELTADVTLIDGKASTPNLKMIGPSATVLMDGTLDLARETQDLNVVVLPDLNPTGGSLVYSVVAANPAVGIASLIADFLLKDPLSKIFSLQYRVTGPWAEPEIRQLNKDNSTAPVPGANSP